MIIKSKSIKDREQGIRRTIEYLFREDKSATLIHSRFIPRQAGIETMIKIFEKVEDNRTYRRKDSAILFHDVISFHSKDSHKLQGDLFLSKIARKYSQMRDQSVTLCILHREQNHVHIHVIAGCRFDGRSARVTKAIFKEKKIELEKLQHELRLVHSRVNHEKKRHN